MPATWVTILPHLLTIWLRESLYRRGVWRCRCVAGPCAAVPAGSDLPGGEWSTCPYGVLRGGQFAALLQVHQLAEVAPLAGWPDGWPAWLAWGMVALRERLREAAAKGGK